MSTAATIKKIHVNTRINAENVEFLCEPRQSLLEALRDVLFLTGTKEGCNNGNCGACSVIMNGRLVNSCVVMAAEAEGAEVTTIEGIAQNGHLHPLQTAFLEHAALQCGICTPGFIVAWVRQFRRSDHGINAVQFQGLTAVDGSNPSMGVRAAESLCVQRSGVMDVGAVLGATGHLVLAVMSNGAGTDDLVLGICLGLWKICHGFNSLWPWARSGKELLQPMRNGRPGSLSAVHILVLLR